MTLQMKIIGALICAVILAVSATLGVQQISEWRAASLQNEDRARVLSNTSDGIEQGTVINKAQSDINNGLLLGRDDFNRSMENAKQTEPVVAERADRPVPVSVRNAYRERRRARERLGCAGSECEGGR